MRNSLGSPGARRASSGRVRYIHAYTDRSLTVQEGGCGVQEAKPSVLGPTTVVECILYVPRNSYRVVVLLAPESLLAMCLCTWFRPVASKRKIRTIIRCCLNREQ